LDNVDEWVGVVGIPPEKQKLVVAFGQEKTIREWTEDRRCQVDWNVLNIRLYQGWIPEEAITRPLFEEQRYEAFGERKTMNEWLADPRCRVCRDALGSRLYRGWDFERSISEPPRKRAKPPYVPRLRKLPGPYELGYVAFGEDKCLKEWAADARCAVPYFLLRNRLRSGWNLAEAITVPSGSGARAPNPGSPEKVSGPAPPRRLDMGELYKGWGEIKSLREWLADGRCAVQGKTVSSRLKAGVPLEAALTRRHEKRGAGPRATYAAFGELKTLGEWARDARCAVPRHVLKTRLSRGMPPERAVTTPEVTVRFVEAFGERKSAKAWAKDLRCAVSSTTLSDRLRDGWAPEDAITTQRRW
jgi:hypothetical protein